jgi:hypothetical protein
MGKSWPFRKKNQDGKAGSSRNGKKGAATLVRPR